MQTSSGQAVRNATHRALEARDRVWADSPQWEDWRRQVRAAKTAMVDRWPEYLAILREQVENWGGTVYLAGNAAEARDIILKVARRHGVKRAIQSKSMTAHEIGLGPFLQRQGLTLTETDLGEFIIQLAGHPPAHITAPALHLNRHQIAGILSHHFHLQAPTDPTELTRLAVSLLAPCYAEADLGITGVNFAAAPEGVLVCLENEGNLRLSATLPPVHLALMGWEKMLPGLSHLEPCLRLLPPSATGQRLTSLVHFLKGLKAGPKGSQAFYLVVLDNGRSRLAARPELREALYCLRCGACLNVCPVFQQGGAHLYGRVYPGAIGALLAPFIPPTGDIADLCTQCGRCGEICPAAIELPRKIRGLRRQAPSFRRIRALTGAGGVILGQPRLYRALAAQAHAWGGGAWRPKMREFFGSEFPEESFFEKHQGFEKNELWGKTILATSHETNKLPESAIRTAASPEAGVLGFQPDFTSRMAEAGTIMIQLEGAASLARYLHETSRGEIWLENHPWLLQAAQELNALGGQARLATEAWAPEADTAVTLGLGVIPELGSVLVAAETQPAALLPLRARRHLVLTPPDRVSLTVQEALELVQKQPHSLVTWLTGPTRTADIEKILVLGAQGPAEMTVVLYQP
ncbi:MAG: LUD domain-containing protein [Desulfobaccales bacterium]